jgi:hypothetical protein
MTDDRSDCFLRDELVRLSYVASGVLLTLDHVQNNMCFRDSQRGCISYVVVVVEDRADEIPRISD